MKSNIHENEYLKGWIEDGILYAEFKPIAFDIRAAKACVALRTETVAGRSYPVLVDARLVSNITKEARDYFASEEGSRFITASALVIDSVVGKFLGNFFLQISKPNVPLRLFTNHADALKWLETFRNGKIEDKGI